jgi:cytochrome c553
MDIIGLGILLVLVLLFGYLTYRAVRSRRGALKWVGTVLAGLVTLILGAALVVALMGTMRLNQNYNATNPPATVSAAMTPENLARGEQLASICMGCHGTEGKPPLKGNDFGAGFPIPFGTLWAANLTPAGETKDWTDGEIIRAIREGVHKDGRSLVIMPSTAFHAMSDEDVQALVAYLRSQPPAGEPNPPTRLNVIGSLLVGTIFSSALTVQPHITGPVTAPPRAATAEYGDYLVRIGDCRACHGPELEGGTTPDGATTAPNVKVAVAGYTEQPFIEFFRTGSTLDGEKVDPMQMPWPEYSAMMTDDDLRAVYMYLKSLPAQ